MDVVSNLIKELLNNCVRSPGLGLHSALLGAGHVRNTALSKCDRVSDDNLRQCRGRRSLRPLL